ncbi:DUF934 domain-containing protein [Rhodospirillum rubrum]|uniref:Uncharacterized conserved protein UCP030820 n=1 Tax=Rhodospirillum rubrum (strain ATCC 11170 / ATH 1.1.1 / DSM 467 / LMG 4362 / NCIMB 8255 / S1) TaxID=269796 RepID=Q2RT15_RHORT|nr:DUF934 domain-containing protein [Rhodospirillum rubrum]ABC22730.1 Uncharacterized conserved protein UCP030820 [Rhodospirillum rubrum ATCC 11170]AEO48450.1 hypothetical protein F11_09920 [Rhodospirillum rubrum F11]MBK5954328.1 hypothetical protein [Rhodospirillum rubrum]QXG78722.1 DUF934 domain-containing protein [Rhodospirillum rubrum]HAQ00526.1 DUF934 domain-containing protein [Rhodospirillum rubrum]
MAPLRLDRPVRPASDLVVLDALAALPDDGKALVPLSRWKGERAELIANGFAGGVWLESGEGPEDWGPTLVADLAVLPVIGLRFPRFTDGRGYSVARLLRDRFGYRHELRALGGIGLDQVTLLARCGIDAVESEVPLAPLAVSAVLDRLRHVYQHASDGRSALWAARAAASAQAEDGLA